MTQIPPRRSLWIALTLLTLSAILLSILLSGCASQMCFQPLDCMKLPTSNVMRSCPPPGADWCQFRSRLTPEQMGARVLLYDEAHPEGRVMNPAEVK